MALRVGKLELARQRWPALRMQGVHRAEVRPAHDDQDD
ncbi:hypothetical protein XaFJ1_GM002159 [Xanthomonas albilineans]|nr:hypothetical protein XaFJ1_GM002159 [Xanthomonas albilineans]